MAKARKKTPRGVRRRVRRDGTEAFYAVVKVNGKQIVGTFRDRVQEAERDYLRLKADPLASSVTVGQRRRATSSIVTLARGLEMALEFKRSQGAASERTLNTADINSRAILRVFNGEAPLHELGAREINSFIQRCLKKGLTVRTVKEKYVPLLKTAFKLNRLEWPTEIRALRPIKREMEFFTPEELREVLDSITTKDLGPGFHARERHAALFELLACTGARSGELSRIKVSDIDRQRLRVRLTNNKDAGAVRYVPFTKELLPSIDILIKEISVNAKICPGGERYLSTLCARWKERLNEPRLSGRTLRHTFVTSLLIAGVDPYTVMELAGHSSLQTTMRYVHLCSPHTREAAEKLGKLFNSKED